MLCDNSSLESDKKDLKLVDCSEQLSFCPQFGSKKYCWLVVVAEGFLKVYREEFCEQKGQKLNEVFLQDSYIFLFQV